MVKQIEPELPAPQLVEVFGPMGVRGMLTDLGTMGYRHSGGLINEHSAKELRGTQSVRAYAEMHDFCPVVRAGIVIYQLLVRQSTWSVEAADESQEAMARREFVLGALNDMSSTFDDVVSDALSMLVYGWAFHEVTLKERNGDSPGPDEKGQPLPRSRFDDGLLGWRKVALRHQRTLQQWDIDNHGGVRAMWQMDPSTGRTARIPIQKAVLFRTESAGGNPEGRSLLTSAWKEWSVLKRLIEAEAIGFVRDLNGMPIMRIPPDTMADDAPAAKKKIREKAEKLMTSLQSGNEMASVLLPALFDARGNPLYDFQLIGVAGGQKNFEALGKAIARKEHRILTSMLTAFLLLGQDQVGTQALAVNNSDILLQACNAVTEAIATTFTQWAIRPLIRANGWPEEQTPRLRFSRVRRAPELKELAEFLMLLTNAGAAFLPDPALEAHLQDLSSLPKKTEEM